MIISDLNYLEVVAEDAIEGSGEARLFTLFNFNVVAQSDAFANIVQTGFAYAETGLKYATYNSSLTLIGRT